MRLQFLFTAENEDGSNYAKIDRSENSNTQESLKEFSTENKYVPTTGSDKDNIPKMYQTLKVHCYCFYSKGEVLEAKNAEMEALEIIKEKNTVTQVRMKFKDWKEHVELIVDITDVQFTQFMGRLKKGDKVTSARNSDQTDFYDPFKEAKRIEYYKEMLRKCDRENEKTKARVEAARKEIVKETKRMMYTYRDKFRLLKRIAHDEDKSTIDSKIWKNISQPVEMFIEFMKSPYPVVFVDMTYELLLNMIPTGIYNDFGPSPKDIPCTYSPCRTLGGKVVKIVSYQKIFIYYTYIF